MKFKVNTRFSAGKNNREKGVDVTLTGPKGDESFTTDVVLLSIGRRPFTGGLQIEKAGLTLNERGQVPINKHWQTSVPNIYAIGDVVEGQMLAHKAEEEGIAAVEQMLGEGGHVNYDAIPGVIYTHPEVANVGKSEE